MCLWVSHRAHRGGPGGLVAERGLEPGEDRGVERSFPRDVPRVNPATGSRDMSGVQAVSNETSCAFVDFYCINL